MSKVKSHLRGGARAGAGRKPKKDKRVQLSTTISPDTMAFLKCLKKGSDMSIGEIIDGITYTVRYTVHIYDKETIRERIKKAVLDGILYGERD